LTNKYEITFEKQQLEMQLWIKIVFETWGSKSKAKPDANSVRAAA
jgi:hypothetical protein